MMLSAGTAGAWAGRELGSRTVSYDEGDAILYALAVGAAASDLDLVYEKNLRVLPSFGLTLAQWAPDVLAEQGVFGDTSVHGSQTLDVVLAMPPSGSFAMASRVGNVWDKGSAAIFEVIVECEYFTALWTIFSPGAGGFGGERGPSATPAPENVGDVLTVQTARNQAALYRLLGDRHDIHIDPAASRRIGYETPILQGLCTVAAVTLPLARAGGAHPADLRHLAARFTGAVTPGQQLTVHTGSESSFDVSAGGATVISHGIAVFA